MPFVRVPGLRGLLYVPETDGTAHKKHDCPDCFSCQVCSDDRCGVCRKEKPESGLCRNDGNNS